MGKSIIDVFIPECINNDENKFNALMSYVNADDKDTILYFKEKLLNMLSDLELLELYYSSKILDNTFSKVYTLIDTKQHNLNMLLNSIYDSGIITSDAKVIMLDGFNIDVYAKDFIRQTKVTLIHNKDTSNNGNLIISKSFIQYVLYNEYNIPKSIIKSIYKSIYNNYIRYMLSREYHVSNLPIVNLDKNHLINEFYAKCSI